MRKFGQFLIGSGGIIVGLFELKDEGEFRANYGEKSAGNVILGVLGIVAGFTELVVSVFDDEGV